MKKMFPLLLSGLFFIYQDFAFSAFDAKVSYLKGEATKLVPGSKVATLVRLGDLLPEDTSVLTHKQSVLKITMNDGTVLSLGPNSKVVLTKNDRPEKPKVVSLLMGRVRAQIIKNQKDENSSKFYLKTRNAAMGVRGTVFESIYNPEINSTSTITLKGNVLMAKLNDKKEENQQLDQTLEKTFKNEDSVQVTKGRFSGVVDSLNKATVPIKIAPVQFEALVKDVGGSNGGSEEEEDVIENESPPEGSFNEVTGKMAPKSGGYIDLNSGLYLPPPQGSELDPVAKVYIPPKEMGRINEKGEYLAPDGMELDIKRGFIISENSKLSGEEKEKLLSMQEKLNGSVMQNSSELKDFVALTENSKRPQGISLTYVVGAGGTRTEAKNNIGPASQEEDSEMQHHMNVEWKRFLSSQLDLRVNLGMKKIVYSKPKEKNYYQNDKSFLLLGAGFGYHYLKNLIFKLSFVREERPILYSTTAIEIKTAVLSQLRPAIEYLWYRSEEFESGFDLGLKMNFKGQKNGIKVNGGGGLSLKTYANFNIGGDDKMSIFLNYESITIETDQYDSDDQFVGIGVSYILSF